MVGNGLAKSDAKVAKKNGKVNPEVRLSLQNYSQTNDRPVFIAFQNGSDYTTMKNDFKGDHKCVKKSKRL
jgi:hypothetical protein